MIFNEFRPPGSVVDVRRLVSQLRRSENARSETVARLGDANKQLSELKDAAEKHNSIKDKLQVSKNDDLVLAKGKINSLSLSLPERGPRPKEAPPHYGGRLQALAAGRQQVLRHREGGLQQGQPPHPEGEGREGEGGGGGSRGGHEEGGGEDGGAGRRGLLLLGRHRQRTDLQGSRGGPRLRRDHTRNRKRTFRLY